MSPTSFEAGSQTAGFFVFVAGRCTDGMEKTAAAERRSRLRNRFRPENHAPKASDARLNFIRDMRGDAAPDPRWEEVNMLGGFRGRFALGVLALLGGMVVGSAAEAATIYTYAFTQSFGEAGSPITVSGNFSGTADGFDHISLGTLISFHVEASSGFFNASYSALPDFFSYKIGDTNGSTLAFFSLLPDPSYNPLPHVCTGVATAIFCKTDGALGTIAITDSGSQVGVLSRSSSAPTLTLVSAVDSDPVATTPIPGALLLFSTALGGLGAAGAWRRKSPS